MARGQLRFGVVLALLVAVFTAAAAQGSTTRAASGGTELYIVQMELAPAVAYEGGIAGIPATKPGKGKKLDRTSETVQRYVGHLKATHDQALQQVGGAEKVYDYAYVYNGFAARLTEAQAAALERQKDVLAVVANEMVSVDTSSTPKFLGLEDANGLWDRLRGPKGNGAKGGAGEDVIIGIVDSGIWPDSPSFSDRRIQNDKLGKVTYGPVEYLKLPDGWRGTCQTGEQFTAQHCNNKLIGARHFNAVFGGDAGLKAQRPWEFASPRDYHGHGTHTASTAGGNHGVPATGAAATFGKISGIAPRARIAAYKALWSTADASVANGGTVDLAAAIDTAVADGVDVINYSVSGTTTNFLDPVQVSFLFAADAGIFVSASAGNSGPTAGTVAHPSPWLTTVAAETHDRVGAGEVATGGTSYAGASAGTGSASGNLVTFGERGSNERLCLLNSLTPAAAGKIVFCERGVNARIEKSFEVQRVGGIGMVLVNPPAGGSLNADLHFVPTVHLQGNHYDAIEAAALAGNSASISGQVLYGQPAPFMAAFSSRGPSSAAGNEVLKPDLGAPGVDILAAVAPPGNRGRNHDLYSGTSMSAPHVAGLGALLKQLHPTWSPMAIKSALMTTASDVVETFTATSASDEAALRAFAQGAGHVRPNQAMNPGLVYDSDVRDWLAFLCGTTTTGVNPATCSALVAAGYSTSRTEVNTPSIALNNLAGARTVTRRVTNVTGSAQTFTATGAGAGIAIAANPSTLTLAPGETKSFEVTVSHTTGTLNRWTAGWLTWSNGAQNVRIPVVARPVIFGSPAEVTSNGSPVSWTVGIGYSGSLSATVGGLVAATTTPITVAQDPDQIFNPADPAGTVMHETAVPAGAVFRAALFHEDVTPANADLDLHVYRCAPTCAAVGSSESGTSTETVTHVNGTEDATYRTYVHAWSSGSAPQATTTLYTWAVPTTPAGNVVVSGVTSPVTAGTTQSHTATFSGLAGGTRYLGRVDYADGATFRGRTLLNVRTP